MSVETPLHPQELKAPEIIDSGEILRRQSPEVQKIVRDDPRLRDNLSKITNLEEFFRALEANKHIFLQEDNKEAKETFLIQSLKGFGYGQMTSDGRDFSVLTEKDVKGLTDAEYDKYKEWKIAQKKATIIELKDERKDVQANIIELQKKNKETGELIKKLGLSSEGEKELDTRFQKAKADENNPIARDLISKGIDPKSSDYDNLLRASIILSNTAKFREFSTNKNDFDESIARLDTMGIPRDISLKIADINTHIDARFPKSSATETAKSEISRSIASGSIASISYDGRGEKYTLIDRDGHTSKEVYMNPPRVRIMRSGLTIEQEVPERKDEDKRLDIQSKLKDTREKSDESIRIFTRDMTDRTIMNEEHVELVSTETYKSSYMTLLSNAPIEKRRESAEKLRAIYMNARDGRTPNKDIYDRKYSELGDIIQKLDKESMAEKNYQNLPVLTSLPMERFDAIASTNLRWLIENKFDRIGSSANEVISRVIGAINSERNRTNQISLEAKVLDISEKNTLIEALSQLGGTPDVFTNEKRLIQFRNKLNPILSLNASEKGSIESTIKKTE